jgi:hypothetical protein
MDYSNKSKAIKENIASNCETVNKGQRDFYINNQNSHKLDVEETIQTDN